MSGLLMLYVAGFIICGAIGGIGWAAAGKAQTLRVREERARAEAVAAEVRQTEAELTGEVISPGEVDAGATGRRAIDLTGFLARGGAREGLSPLTKQLLASVEREVVERELIMAELRRRRGRLRKDTAETLKPTSPSETTKGETKG